MQTGAGGQQGGEETTGLVTVPARTHPPWAVAANRNAAECCGPERHSGPCPADGPAQEAHVLKGPAADGLRVLSTILGTLSGAARHSRVPRGRALFLRPELGAVRDGATHGQLKGRGSRPAASARWLRRESSKGEPRRAGSLEGEWGEEEPHLGVARVRVADSPVNGGRRNKGGGRTGGCVSRAVGRGPAAPQLRPSSYTTTDSDLHAS